MSGKTRFPIKGRCAPGVPPALPRLGAAAGPVLLALLLLLTGPAAAFPADEAETRDKLKPYGDELVRKELARMEFAKGKLYFEDKFYEPARRQMQAALKLDREHVDARYYLGLVESRCGEHKLALEHFLMIYKKKLRHRELCFEIAYSHLALGQCAEARTWLERYLKQKPESEKAGKLRKKIRDCLKKEEKSGGQKRQ